MIGRFIFHCDDENLVLASRAAQWLLKNSDKREGYLAYGNKIEMYVKRLKASITVRQVRP